MIYQLDTMRVQLLGTGHFIAKSADIIGNVSLGDKVSVWFHAVIRGDLASISVGDCSNIQDGSVLHVDRGVPLTVGKFVTVGHQVTLHGCLIGDYSLIGMQSVILNNAKIGKRCLIGAHSLVTEGTRIPDGHLAMGAPAKVIRPLTDEEIRKMRENTDNYVKNRELFNVGLSEDNR